MGARERRGMDTIPKNQEDEGEKKTVKNLSEDLDGTATLSRPLDLDPTRTSREHRVRHRSAQARNR
jgi:hypothetical protein